MNNIAFSISASSIKFDCYLLGPSCEKHLLLTNVLKKWLKRLSKVALAFLVLLPVDVLGGNVSYYCKYHRSIFFNIYTPYGDISCYSKIKEKSQKEKKTKPDNYQIGIRIHNKDRSPVKIYVSPKLGYFFHKGDAIKDRNKLYFFKIGSNDKSAIYILAQESDVNYTARADGKIYFGSKNNIQSCYIHVKFKIDEDNRISDISCLGNFIMKPCYEKYKVSFTYTKNIIDIVIYNRDSSKYINNGSC